MKKESLDQDLTGWDILDYPNTKTLAIDIVAHVLTYGKKRPIGQSTSDLSQKVDQMIDRHIAQARQKAVEDHITILYLDFEVMVNFIRQWLETFPDRLKTGRSGDSGPVFLNTVQLAVNKLLQEKDAKKYGK